MGYQNVVSVPIMKLHFEKDFEVKGYRQAHFDF